MCVRVLHVCACVACLLLIIRGERAILVRVVLQGMYVCVRVCLCVCVWVGGWVGGCVGGCL